MEGIRGFDKNMCATQGKGVYQYATSGTYIEPECKHLKERVEEIAEGKCEEAIRANMALSDAEIREMYNNREIEK